MKTALTLTFAAFALSLAIPASLLLGPDDIEAAQDVSDEAAYAAAVADGGASKCAALGRTAILTPEGHLICRLPARQPSAATTVAQGGRP